MKLWRFKLVFINLGGISSNIVTVLSYLIANNIWKLKFVELENYNLTSLI